MTTAALAAVALGLAAPAGSVAPVSTQAVDIEAGLRLLQAGDLQVASIAYRLAAANGELCAQTGPISGLVLHELGQYGGDYRLAAARLFALDSAPGISGVIPGSPAEQAGLRANDTLLAINGIELAATPDRRRRGSYDAMAATLARLDAALAAGPAALTIARGTKRLEARLIPAKGCAYRVQLLPDPAKDAGSDGRQISITTGMATYAQSDDELAVVIAHEMAHNALRHPARLREAGVGGGLARHFGRNAAKVRDTEREADYLGLYMMARAGYDMEAALRFWQRYGRATDLGIFSDPTHPRWRQREAALRLAADEIARKRERGERLIPEAGRLAGKPH